MKKNLLFVLAVLMLAGTVTGCNMMRGAGQDVENAGAGIQRTVNHND
jgi:predicted small secreted protein